MRILKSVLLAWIVAAASACPSALSESDALARKEIKASHRAELKKLATELVARMTLDEKASLVSMSSGAIERLNIPEHDWWSEALHGVGRNGVATQFPQSICMAATWNPELIEEMASAIGDEARAKHHARPHPVKRYQGLTVWSPTINLARDPRWGRTEETYGEDPWLTSRMAVAFVKGLQGDHPKYLKAVATVKHFICNNTEYNRRSIRPHIPEKYLRDYFMIPFRAAVEEADVQSVMTAYNGINDVPCGANGWLLTDVLRGEWGFTGSVVTDVNVPSFLTTEHGFTESQVDAAAAMLEAGVDVICDRENFGRYVKAAIKKGLMSEAELDEAIIQNLATRLELGQVLDSADNPFARIPMSVVGSDKHCGIAREIAKQGIVLLKNEAGLLPIDRKRIRKIVVTGPYADVAQLGGYSGTPTKEAVTPYEGLAAAAGRDVSVVLRRWNGDLAAIPTANLRPAGARQGVYGLKGDYFAGITCEGIPEATRTDEDVDFSWPKPIENVDPDVPRPKFAVRWTGSLVPDLSGDYVIAGRCDDGVRIWLDGKKIVDDWSNHSVRTSRSKSLKLQAGKAYDLRMEYYDNGGDAEAHLQWSPPRDEVVVGAEERDSTLVVYVCGFNLQMADESRDLMSLTLPKDQMADLQETCRAYPNTVVVFNGGTILTGNWVYDNVPAILHAWYPGQEGGHALADLLLGRVSPSGRLPLTSYLSTRDLPDMDDYVLSRGRTYMYCRKKVRYPFGHGLSYVSFDHANLALSKSECTAADTLAITLTVRNSGAMRADEVVQVYARRLRAGGGPIQQLVAFKRVTVPGGRVVPVRIELPVQSLQRWNSVTSAYEVAPGQYELRVGASSADIRQRATVTIRESRGAE